VLVVHPSLGVGSVRELVALAKKEPGKIDYASSGNGSAQHLVCALFNSTANVKLNHVPYKGAGPALQDLIGGQIDVVFDPGVGIAPAKAGKVRMIAVAGPARHPDFPDIPTLEENGIKGVDGGPHFGFYAPANTPKETLQRINAEVQKAMQHPPVRDRFKALAVDVAEAMTPDQFADYVRGEHARYAKLIAELGIKP
jgi:tripartite-type tricarboxylate transporter receptor subunit TctC